MKQKLLLTTVIGILLLSNLALAVPGLPNAFYGTVTWNGSPAPDGTTVTAKIDGVEVASTTTKDGKYGYNPTLVINDPENDRTGSIINFFVNGVDTGQTGIFANGKVTPLNLVASGETTQPPSGGGPISPGGSGFVPSGGTTTPEGTPEEEGPEEETGACEERWVCDDWSECKEDKQTRVCEDVNKCGTDNDMPMMVQPCTKEEQEKTETTEAGAGAGPTGFFLGLSTTEWAIGGIIGIIVAVVIIFLIVRISRKK